MKYFQQPVLLFLAASLFLLSSCASSIRVSPVQEPLSSKEIVLFSSLQPKAPELEPALFAWLTTHGYTPKIVQPDYSLDAMEYGLRFAANRETYGSSSYARRHGIYHYSEHTLLKSVDLWLYRGQSVAGEAHYFIGHSGLGTYPSYEHIPTLLEVLMPQLLVPQPAEE